jgi:ABC-2 type transport system permease protein
VTIGAIFFFGFNLWQLGFAVAAFFGNLILTSWTIGLLASGMVLKKVWARKARLEPHLSFAAARLRILPRCHPAGVAAVDLACPAARPTSLKAYERLCFTRCLTVEPC